MPSNAPLAALSAYPGRGVVVFRSGGVGVEWLYFITGRSDSSRARRFVVRERELAVVPTDDDAEPDQLRHYVCVVQTGDGTRLVIGNGDHVQQIEQSLARAGSPADTIRDLSPEADPPINTPRIAAVLGDDRTWLLSVASQRDQVERRAEVIELAKGEAVVLHTYSGTPDEPVGSAPRFRLRFASPRALPDLIWQSLNPDHRVGLAAGIARSAQPTCLIPETHFHRHQD